MNLNNVIPNLVTASARRPWVTIGIWLAALAVSGVLIMTLLNNALVNKIDITNNPESKQATTLINDRLGQANAPATEDETVIVKSATLTVDDPVFRSTVESVYQSLIGLGQGIVLSGTDFYISNAGSLVSTDRHSTIISLTMVDKAENYVDQVYAIGDKVSQGGQFQVFYTGTASFNADTTKLADQTLAKGETIGILVALVVLAIVFGALVAALLPVALGVVAIVLALGLTSLVGQLMHLSFFVTNIVTMMGLAVGIDYSLFVVSRFREERKKGIGKLEAIAITGRTANKAIFFSGMTVVLALIGLLVFPLSIFKSMGLGAILVVMSAIIASMTILPAIISLLGDRVNKLRMPFSKKSQSSDSTKVTGFWAALVRVVTHTPILSIAIVASIMLLALIPYFGKNSGFSGISGLPDNLRAKAGYTELQQDFHVSVNAPAIIAVDGDINAAATQLAINKLTSEIASDKNFTSTNLASYPDKNLDIIYANLAGDPQSIESINAVIALRENYIPSAFTGSQAKALVTGQTAGTLDFNQTTSSYTPFIFAFVLSLAFIILLVAFRSIVIPTTAIIMNLLSVGTAYGLLVLVFQKGIGAHLFGFVHVDVIETWLPLFLFSLLFGLSMDYQVFLLSRIRENYLQTGKTSEAVAFGLWSTGKLITGAALIMVAVFGGFTLGHMAMFQEMGFGLGVAVLVDATLVRCVLVPATMTLLGKRNWYLPKWLNWIPNVSLGETRGDTEHR